MHDAIIIGGGPAGLQAALTLGRLHRSAVLLDSGEYRNDPTAHMQNFITHDGRAPADFRAAARADLAAYDTVEVRETRATSISGSLEDGFTVETTDGPLRARRILLATGMRDNLPDVPGIADLFGTLAAHCPFCHGHEYAGEHVALLGNAAHAARMIGMMGPVADRITVFTQGEDVSALSVDASIVEEKVVSARRVGDKAVLTLASGEECEVGGILLGTTLTQAAPFAEQLGLTLQASGAIRIDAFGHTSLPGVYAAGDLAHTDDYPMPMAAVITAAAAGMIAGSMIIGDAL